MLQREMENRTTFDQTRSRRLVRAFNVCERRLNLAMPRASDLILLAKERNRLDDFGEGDFFEPLSRLLEACQREANLHAVGKIALRADLLRTLTNRLLMARDRTDDPQIRAQEIRQPLFILGLPRSGTTLLHMLLSTDPAHRAPLTWEVMSPSPASSEGLERRRAQAQRDLSRFSWLAPTFSRVHPFGANLPQECVGLMSSSLMSDQFDTMYRVPSYRNWFLKQDLSPAYACHRQFLQHLQTRVAARRWVVKAPVHMFALPTLLSFYPDALFVQVHRDPLEAIASVSSLVAILRSAFSDAVDPLEVGRDALNYWAETMTAFLPERDRIAQSRFCDVYHRDLRSNPIAAVRRIYDRFGWPFSADAENRMELILAGKAANSSGTHRYEPAQFGLDAGQVNRSFLGYRERFGFAENNVTDWRGTGPLVGVNA